MNNLHLGCFDRPLPGWVNVDVTPHGIIARVPGAARIIRGLGLMTPARYEQHRAGIFRQVGYLDVRKRFPYPDNSFDNIFSAHMLEHLRPKDARHCLAETLRVLRPGGVVRITVPDLDLALAGYDSNNPDGFLETVYVAHQDRDKNRHHWMYTGASLTKLLREVGFSQAYRTTYREGRCPDLEQLDNRPDVSLFVEAIK
jgi:SAM-dependent methyltransferase